MKFDSNRVYGFAGDLSAGGMFIGTDSPRVPGERFVMTFELPDGGPVITAEAEVMWVREGGGGGPGMGVRFRNLEGEAVARIESFVKGGKV